MAGTRLFTLNPTFIMEPYDFGKGCIDYQYFRQCVGIDVAKNEFHARMCMFQIGLDYGDFSEDKIFSNSKTGFNQLVRWARKEFVKGQEFRFIMEATGSYHELLACHLHACGFTVFVVPPLKAHHFAQYYGFSVKTDRVDAYVLSILGCVERRIKPWLPPSPLLARLRSLTRTRYELADEKVSLSNRIEAVTHMKDPARESVKALEQSRDYIDGRIKMLEGKIEQTLKSDADLWRKCRHLQTIPGVGLNTCATVIAETNGFEFVISSKQLVSFAGLDVKIHDSGMLKGKSRISKKGNKFIRRALYMPALSASSCNPQQKQLYERLIERRGNAKGVKIYALTAVMRKLLVVMFSLWKNDADYDSSM